MSFQALFDWLIASGFQTLAKLLSFIFGLIIMIVQVKKYKFLKNQSKEDSVKYRVASYREKTASPSQSFDTEVDQYRLNKSTNVLEKLPDKVDIQKLVQSAEQQSLGNMLAHLEPAVTETDKVVDVRNDLLDNLDILRDADDYRFSLCSKYGLSDATSMDDVIKYLEQQEAEVRGKLSVLQQSVKKEDVVNNEEKKL